MEIAAAALQFTSTAFQAFRGCILAIEFFETAQHMGADGDLFRAGLEFEKYRLMAWADRVGLLAAKEQQTLNWQLAGIILQQLESFLTSAHKLKAEYALDVTEEEIQAAQAALVSETPRQGISRLIARLKPDLRTIAGKIIQEHNSAIKRIRWAARDRAKLKAYLGEISSLVYKLEFLLDSSERQQGIDDYDRLLRGVISLATTTVEAGQIKDFLDGGQYQRKAERSINAAAYSKQVRLVLGADQRHDEIGPKNASETVGLKMPNLAILKRSLRPWGQGELFSSNLEFGAYRDKQVLIQWKTVESTQWELYTSQMKCLAVFLMSASDPSFRSPRCLGYYPLQKLGRHGIMYSMPDDEIDWDLKSLKDLIADQPFASLKRRLELARSLADTVLQLHTAGWLHKGLRSDNIIFLAPRGSSTRYFLNTAPHVIGYEYARSDTADSATAFTQLPDTDLEADLYRHPQARGARRESFQKRFDLYAMACVLVELAMWKPLIDVFSEHMMSNLKELVAIASASNEIIELPGLKGLLDKEEAVRCLKYQAGDAVLEVIKLCALAENPEEGDEGLLTEQNEVVEKLAWCRI